MGFWWSKADWPAAKGKERRYHFFEDIRKLLFLIERPSVGNLDIYRYYGKKVGDIYVAYDENNWPGSWTGFAPPNLAKPGEITVVYKDHTGAEDIFINWISMSEATLEKYPPIKPDGKLDTRYWRLGVNPNYYCHYNHNAGRPEIGADGRYVVIYHGASEEYGFSPYVCDLKAHKWLPRHTHPYRQVAPLKYKSGEVKQRRDPALYGVETKDKYITQSIGTEWDRSKDTSQHQPDISPRRLSEYVLEMGEPEDTGSGCKGSGRCAHDPKMCEAYQDRVIRTVEHEGQFLKEVDQDYIDAWSWAQGTKYSSGTTYFEFSSIVYVGDWCENTTKYLCIKSGQAPEPPDVEWWITPCYQPTLVENHSGYAYLSDEFWCCNSSAFELLLREIDSFDWWWDTKHPAVPWLLYDAQFGDGSEDWPLPRGCWRRTWKHSMGRVGAMMWPQEKGEPPGYSKFKLIVSQAVYDGMPEANQKHYIVSDVEGLYNAAYTDEHEALIKKRHNPKAVGTAKTGEATIIEPHYEIHHDLVNDMWNILLELTLLDWPGTQATWVYRGIASSLGGGGVEEPTSLEAYAAARNKAIAEQEWIAVTEWGSGYWPGYLCGVGSFGYPTRFWMCYDTKIINAFALSIKIPVNDILPGMLFGKMLLRIKWNEIYFALGGLFRGTECVFGFEDKTLTATPTYNENEVKSKWSYVGLEPYPFAESGNYYYFWFFGYILSPWPFSGKGEWMDFDGGDHIALSNMEILSVSSNSLFHSTVFELDWDKVPKSVFEELETNFIKIKALK